MVFQVKLLWDENDEACGVCGDDEQAEGYDWFASLGLPLLLLTLVAFDSLFMPLDPPAPPHPAPRPPSVGTSR